MLSDNEGQLVHMDASELTTHELDELARGLVRLATTSRPRVARWLGQLARQLADVRRARLDP